MALVTDGFWGTISLSDNGGQVSTLTYELTAALIATAITDMATIIAALQAVTNSVISAYTIQERFLNDALVLPADGVQNENKASMTVTLVGGGNRANIKVPAPKIEMFSGTEGEAANRINALEAIVLAYYNLFTAGNEALLSDGQVADLLIGGKRIHAKSNFG